MLKGWTGKFDILKRNSEFENDYEINGSSSWSLTAVAIRCFLDLFSNTVDLYIRY
jgi:hypothetical protein